MILNTGRQNVLQLLSGNPTGKKITGIVVGTGTNVVTADDTACTGSVTSVITKVEYLPGNVERYTAVLPAEIPSMTISEMGLVNDAGILVHRKLLPSTFAKALGLAYTLKYEIKVV